MLSRTPQLCRLIFIAVALAALGGIATACAGRSTARVPDVAGLSIGAATARVTAAGLCWQLPTSPPILPADRVIAYQRPAANTKAPRGSVVTISVYPLSSGRRLQSRLPRAPGCPAGIEPPTAERLPWDS